jgi:hypothetical protein
MKKRTSAENHRKSDTTVLIPPKLYCPFPTLVNDHAEMVNRQTNVWVHQHRLLTSEPAYQRFATLGMGWLAARTTPHATLAALRIVTDWCSWFFLHDDYCDESGVRNVPDAMAAMHHRYYEILQDAAPTVEDAALTHALHDLWYRTKVLMSTPLQERFIINLKAFFDAGVWEAKNRAQDTIPTLADYLKMRPITSGLYAYFDLLEVSEALSLPDELRIHPVIQRLTSLANNVVSWANDILSLAKEMRLGDHHNLVIVLQHHHDIPLQTAFTRAAHHHDTDVRDFIRLEQQLPRFNDGRDDLLARYVMQLRLLMRGSLEWLSTSGRYTVKSF